MTVKKQKKVVKEGVISKIEITTSPTIPTTDVEEKPTVDARSLSLMKYHNEVKEMSREITKFAISVGNENLLSVKMALMESVREVERKMKENREV